MRVPLHSWSWLLALLLVALGALQYRWIGELSQADRARLERARIEEAQAFANAVNAEVTRLFAFFLPRRGDRGRAEVALSEKRIAERIEGWRAEEHGGLLGELVLVEAAFSNEARARAWRDGVLQPVALEGDLDLLGKSRRRRGAGRATSPILPSGRLVVPQARPRPARGPFRPPDALLVLELDSRYLSEQLLPAAAERLQLADFDVGVRTTADDWLFATRPVDDFTASDLAGSLPILKPSPGPVDESPGLRQARAPGRDGPWRIYVQHRRGSIDGVVRAARQRNLLLSLGTLSVLGASMVLVTAAAARAQRTAEQQVTFVGSLTHELHTPLAAISAAAANLADGIVADGDRVRDYGKLIQREGRRLEGLVSQALQLAGIRSGSKPRAQSLQLGQWVAESLEGCSWLAEERGVALSTEIDAPETEFTGEAEALVQVLRNVLTNALKHGPEGSTVLVRSRVEPNALQIDVLDEGEGFPAKNRRQLLEPFVRAPEDDTAGTGLGLHLAQQVLLQHSGSIELLDRDDGSRGAMVRLHLPRRGDA